MHENNNYALIMLDLNSPSIEVKLQTLDIINSLTDKKRYINGLKKLAKSKYTEVKEKSLSILRSIDVNIDDIDSTKDKYLLEREEVYQLLENNLDKENFKYFNPFIKLDNVTSDKSIHIPSDLRERVQKLLNAIKPLDKVNALFLTILIPFEFKNKVTIIVDLLRDKSPFVVTTTFKYLHLVDKEVLHKVIPVIIERLKIDPPEGIDVIIEFLEEINPEMLKDEITAIKDWGIDAKTAKSLANKLSSLLS